MNSKIIVLLFVLSTLNFTLKAQDEELKSAPDGITAEKVINSYVDAIGGLAKLNKVKSVSMWAKSEIQGNEIRLTFHNAAPNKYYMEMGTPDMTFQKQIFNGEKGVVIAMGNRTEMTSESLEDMKMESVLFRETKLAQLGIQLELLGVATLDAKDAYVVKMIMPNKSEVTDYYDVSTGYKVKSVSSVSSPDGDFQIISVYSDYRAVKGIFFPYKLVQEVGPQTITIETTLITLNKAKDSNFSLE